MREEKTNFGSGSSMDTSPVRRRSLQLDVSDVAMLTKITMSPSSSRNSLLADKASNDAKETTDFSSLVNHNNGSSNTLKPPVPVWGVDRIGDKRRFSLPNGSHVFEMAAGEVMSIYDNETNDNNSFSQNGDSHFTYDNDTSLSLMRVRSGSDVGSRNRLKSGSCLKLNSILKKGLSNGTDRSKERRTALRVSFSDLLDTDKSNNSLGNGLQRAAISVTDSDTSDMPSPDEETKLTMRQKSRRHSFPLIEAPFGLFTDNGNGTLQQLNSLENIAGRSSSESKRSDDDSSSSSAEDIALEQPTQLSSWNKMWPTTANADNGISCTVVHSFTPKRAHSRRPLPPLKYETKQPANGIATNLSVVPQTTADLRTVSPVRRLPPIPGTPRFDDTLGSPLS